MPTESGVPPTRLAPVRLAAGICVLGAVLATCGARHGGAVDVGVTTSEAARHGAATTGNPPAAVRATGTRYTVICHFPCGRIAAQALTVAEAAWPLAETAFPATVATTPRGEIHLYRTARAYRAARRGFLRRAPRALAITSPHERAAHIALRASIADTTLRAYGLPPNVLRIVAHEAFHLAALLRAPQAVHLPRWLNEGAATWAEHEALRAAGLAADPVDEPVPATYRWLAQRLEASGALPAASAIAADEIDMLDEQSRYAVRLLFYTFLREQHAAALGAAVDTAFASRGRGARHARGLRDRLAVQIMGAAAGSAANDRAAPAEAHALDTAFRAYVRALRAPAWVQGGRSLDMLPSGDWLQIGLTGAAEAWRTGFGTAVEVEGTVRFLTGGHVRLLLGTNETGDIAIVLAADSARAWIVRRGDSGEDVLAMLTLAGGGGAADVRSFRLVAARGTLRFAVDDAELAVPLDQHELNGRWGVGADAGVNVIWGAMRGRP